MSSLVSLRAPAHAGTIVLAWAVAGSIASGQTLTLEEAMTRAREGTAAARALSAAEQEATARVRQARAGFLPRVDVTESIGRGDGPVFVFSSLLAQGRFTEANFAIPSLNDPAPLTNLRAAVTVDQSVFDGGRTRLGVRAAELGRDLAAVDRARGTRDLALEAAGAFVAVLRLEAAERAAAGAVAAAESDTERAQARRDAGMVTEADVLAAEVYLAGMRGRLITTTGELAAARVALAEAVGLPLDQTPAVVRPSRPAADTDVRALVDGAIATRAERQQADLRIALAENSRRAARAAFLPTLGVQAGLELNGAEWVDRRTSWMVGAQVQMNLMTGFVDVARVAEARHAEVRATAERERTLRRIEVEVRTAVARLEAARARDVAERSALTQAQESQRIIRDRYETGLATVTDVLRAAEAVLDAESRSTEAEMDVILGSVALDRAAGRL